MSVRFGDSTIGADIQNASLNADINAPSLSIKFNAPTLNAGTGPQRIGGQAYAGPYTVTPTTSTQTLTTSGKTMNQDVVVDPIPSNYGLITWNGSTLTVS